jgi:hypothetical protein
MTSADADPEELSELLEDADEYEVVSADAFVVRSGTDVVWKNDVITHGEHFPDVEAASERFAELAAELR